MCFSIGGLKALNEWNLLRIEYVMRERERDRSYESGHSHSHHWTVLLSLAKCVTFLPCWADNSPHSSDTNNNLLDTKKKQSLWEVKSSVRQSTMDIWIFVWLLISCCRLSVTGRLAITDSTQSGTIFKSGESFELQCTSNIPWFLCIWDTPGILRSGILITFHCRSDLYLRCKLLAQHKEIQRDEGEGLVVNCKWLKYFLITRRSKLPVPPWRRWRGCLQCLRWRPPGQTVSFRWGFISSLLFWNSTVECLREQMSDDDQWGPLTSGCWDIQVSRQ